MPAFLVSKLPFLILALPFLLWISQCIGAVLHFFVNVGLFVFILKGRVPSFVFFTILLKLKFSVLVLQKRCCLAIFGRSTERVCWLEKFSIITYKHLHYGNSSVRHCCDIKLLCLPYVHQLSTNFLNKAKEVVLGLIDVQKSWVRKTSDAFKSVGIFSSESSRDEQ